MISDRLSRRESEVMCAVYRLSEGKERFLVFPYEIAALLPSGRNYREEEIEDILRALEMDGYFEFVLSDRKGEKTYVVRMRTAGLSYRRADAQRKRGAWFRLAFTAVGAVVTFLIGVVLRLIFQSG